MSSYSFLKTHIGKRKNPYLLKTCTYTRQLLWYMIVQKKEKKYRNYRKLVVWVLLSLPHWPGILEFMDFIYCVEAEEGEKPCLSKLKLLLAIYSLIDTG